jgi:hypothetical protein
VLERDDELAEDHPLPPDSSTHVDRTPRRIVQRERRRGPYERPPKRLGVGQEAERAVERLVVRLPVARVLTIEQADGLPPEFACREHDDLRSRLDGQPRQLARDPRQRGDGERPTRAGGLRAGDEDATCNGDERAHCGNIGGGRRRQERKRRP